MVYDEDRLRRELAKVTDLRDPPVAVWAARPLEEAVWPGLLFG